MSVETAVIGGGSAGAAVAGRLAEAGREIVLLERGPDDGPPQRRALAVGTIDVRSARNEP